MSDSRFKCATCSAWHEGPPMCFGWPAPDLLSTIHEAERKERTELSSDQCVIDGKYFFVLGRILIPVMDGPEPFCWLAWVSLSEKSFRRMRDLWTTPGRESEPPYFGWLQTALPYEPTTINLKTSVQTASVGDRPLIQLEHSGHPLAVEQCQGITMERVRAIAERALHR